MGSEDLLEEEMATHSSILAWRIPWIDEAGRLQPVGSQKIRHDLVTIQQMHQAEDPPGASVVKNPMPMQMWVRSLSREDLLEKEMETHFSILAWKIPWTEEPGRLQYLGLQRVGHD